MNALSHIQNILSVEQIKTFDVSVPHDDELYLAVDSVDFVRACCCLHKHLESSVMMFFPEDLRVSSGHFALYCVFLDVQSRSWVFVRQNVRQDKPEFVSLAKDIYSAAFFEREIREMFGIEPVGNPDLRSLRLHDEVWPRGYYPLRKDFVKPAQKAREGVHFSFKRVEGEGIFEVPVGPVHAGIIGSGHFRFSVAGEPIINLEIRLGWTHRGIEKILEGKTAGEAVKIFECISGDTVFGYSTAFCQSVEKILKINVPARSRFLRVLFLELERLYNHAHDIGGIALDVGFSFSAQFASLVKEMIIQLNEELCGSRYLKGINMIGGAQTDIDEEKSGLIIGALAKIQKDLLALEEMLFSSISFMDRVDATGILRVKTARDLGIIGLAGRASGIPLDTRKVFLSTYTSFSFHAAKEQVGDVAARLKVKFFESKESLGLIRQCLEKLKSCDAERIGAGQEKEGVGLGCAEAWRGPVLVWTRLNAQGKIERCKIVDPSFRSWEGLSFAVLGNIIPDFPLCNKSFDLSYSGSDL